MRDAAAAAAVSSVLLETYSLVTAGLADGIPLEELLEHVEVAEPCWRQADRVWTRRLLEDLSASGKLNVEIDRLQREARRVWARPVPPLDSDLRAWIDFLRTLGAHPDPIGRLETLAIVPSDLARLQESWSSRLQADAELRAELERIVAVAPREVSVPRPARPVLPRRARSSDGTTFLVAVKSGETLPFTPGPAVAPAPPVSVPLPAAARTHGLEATPPPISREPRTPVLPFSVASIDGGDSR